MESLLFHSRLSPSSADALVAHSSCSFDRWLLSHWRFFAALPRPVVLTWRTSAPLLALSTEPMMFPALWQVGTARFPFTPGYSTPNPGSPLRVFALVKQSPRSCGRWFLTHWRYPHSALGRWCLRQCALQQRSLSTGSLARASYCSGFSFFESSALLLKLEVIPNNPKNT